MFNTMGWSRTPVFNATVFLLIFCVAFNQAEKLTVNFNSTNSVHLDLDESQIGILQTSQNIGKMRSQAFEIPFMCIGRMQNETELQFKTQENWYWYGDPTHKSNGQPIVNEDKYFLSDKQQDYEITLKYPGQAEHGKDAVKFLYLTVESENGNSTAYITDGGIDQRKVIITVYVYSSRMVRLTVHFYGNEKTYRSYPHNGFQLGGIHSNMKPGFFSKQNNLPHNQNYFQNNKPMWNGGHPITKPYYPPNKNQVGHSNGQSYPQTNQNFYQSNNSPGYNPMWNGSPPSSNPYYPPNQSPVDFSNGQSYPNTNENNHQNNPGYNPMWNGKPPNSNPFFPPNKNPFDDRNKQSNYPVGSSNGQSYPNTNENNHQKNPGYNPMWNGKPPNSNPFFPPNKNPFDDRNKQSNYPVGSSNGQSYPNTNENNHQKNPGYNPMWNGKPPNSNPFFPPNKNPFDDRNKQSNYSVNSSNGQDYPPNHSNIYPNNNNPSYNPLWTGEPPPSKPYSPPNNNPIDDRNNQTNIYPINNTSVQVNNPSVNVSIDYPNNYSDDNCDKKKNITISSSHSTNTSSHFSSSSSNSSSTIYTVDG